MSDYRWGVGVDTVKFATKRWKPYDHCNASCTGNALISAPNAQPRGPMRWKSGVCTDQVAV